MAAFDHLFSKRHVIVMCAPNGARKGSTDHPAVPITPAEIAGCAEEVLDQGVSVLHLHVRDEKGAHSLDPERYRAAIGAIRDRVGDALVLQVTTEAVGLYTREEQMASVRELRPEAVSLALRELVPSSAEEQEAASFFAWLERERIWPQYILYTPEEVQRFDELRRRGLFSSERPFVLLVLGRYSDASEGSLDELDAMLEAADCTAFPWAVCCFGSQEHAAARVATARGGHVRIGFENNLILSDGSVARDNAALIRQYCDTGIANNRRPATAADIRSERRH